MNSRDSENDRLGFVPRRWLRFRLRSVLLLMWLVGAFLAWHFGPPQRQRRAIVKLLTASEYAHVTYDYQVSKGIFYKERNVPGPAWLRNAIGDDFFREVIALYLFRGTVGTEELGAILQLRGLRELELQESSISDETLERLTNLRNLRSLNLADTNVTDRSVDTLVRFPNLDHVNVANTKLTEEGLDRLVATLPDCEIVW